MPTEHARLSASGSKKWLNCPASIQLEEQFPNKTSEFAEEGTKAHEIGELKILKAAKVKSLNIVKRFKALEPIAEDMQEYTDQYRDFVIESLNQAKQHCPDATLLVEQRLDFSKYVPGGFGTGDVVIIADDVLEIIDLKYGKGVKVSAQSNPQLMLYALGALDAFDFLYDIKTVKMAIFQPRIDNIDTFEISKDELLKWGETVKAKAAKAIDEDCRDCIAGAHCDDGFCRARPICRAYAERSQKIAKYDFALPATLSVDEIAEILMSVKQVQNWTKLVSDYALDQAVNHGVEFPGFKLVEGRSNRKYGKSDEEIINVLTENGYKKDAVCVSKLKGIGDMEKMLGKNKFTEILGDYIVKPQGEPTLVPMDDKRPAINSAQQATEDFKDLIDNN